MVESETKLFRSGNSDAVRLSKDIVNALSVQPGDRLIVQFDPATKSVSITKGDEADTTVDPAFMKMMDQIYDDNKDAMDLLKDL